ncbi:MAG: META domain-containing protein [Bacteroidaceae bacterium]|nr:META domain-containing protein [Bacteroidaceae bacterium]
MKKTLLSALVASTFLFSCTNEKNTGNTTTANITGEWNIAEANGISTENSENLPFIHFTDSGTVHGNASVNTFFGEYVLKGDSLFFEQMAATSMMGHDMEVEMAVMSALAQCATVDIQDSTLNVKNHDGNVVMSLTRN